MLNTFLADDEGVKKVVLFCFVFEIIGGAHLHFFTSPCFNSNKAGIFSQLISYIKFYWAKLNLNNS